MLIYFWNGFWKNISFYIEYSEKIHLFTVGFFKIVPEFKNQMNIESAFLTQVIKACLNLRASHGTTEACMTKNNKPDIIAM